MYAFQKLNDNEQLIGYNFYDLNFKANWIINDKNRLFFSIYNGHDRLSNHNKSEGNNSLYAYKWGNITSVLRWNKTVSPHLFANTSVYYSYFDNTEIISAKDEETDSRLKLASQLSEWCLKTDIDWYKSDRLTLRLGAKVSTLRFSPSIVHLRGIDYNTTLNEDQQEQAFTSDIYWENELNLGRVNANIGLRGSGYWVNGIRYFSVQPRFSADINMENNLKLNLSFMNTSQHLHLLSNSSMGLPTDLWVASTKNIEPQRATQFSVGIEKRFPATNLLLAIEGYYKKMNHVTRFNEGSAFLNRRESNWENSIAVGKGEAYGAEFLFQKEKGRFNWMVSYTLSWSERCFNGINQGRWFPFKYDRRHDVSCLLNYRLSPVSAPKIKNITLGFTFQSGNNITIYDTETSGAILPGLSDKSEPIDWIDTRQTYSTPNNYKMPAFHHLDINYLITNKTSSNKTYEWSFSLYNAYCRQNPWYLYKKDGKIKQVSIFPIVPSVSFKYTW